MAILSQLQTFFAIPAPLFLSSLLNLCLRKQLTGIYAGILLQLFYLHSFLKNKTISKESIIPMFSHSTAI